jgi:hypothetical protein
LGDEHHEHYFGKVYGADNGVDIPPLATYFSAQLKAIIIAIYISLHGVT